MTKIVLIQASLNDNSRTSIVINKVAEDLKVRNLDFEIIDLRKLNLEFCNGRSKDEYNEDMQNAFKKMQEADAYVIGMPFYCYSFSGVLKNFLDITSARRICYPARWSRPARPTRSRSWRVWSSVGPTARSWVGASS